MGRSPKCSKEVKIKACEDYHSGKGSYLSIAKQIGVNKSTVHFWYRTYQEHGEKAFEHSSRNRSYSKEFKESIVQSYVSGNSSLLDLSSKFDISSKVVRRWIQRYYNGIEQAEYNPKVEVYTMESRTTTFDDRLEVVKWVINHDMNYKEAASKFAIKYSIVYSWVRKYLRDGEDALRSHKRGPKAKVVIDEEKMSEVDRLKYELEREQALRKRAEFELEVLKKKEEFEKKIRSRK